MATSAVQVILLGSIVSVPVGLAGAWFAPPLLVLMGATAVLAHSMFATIVLGLDGVVLMLFLINAVFRGGGDAAVAMRVPWIANAINICLDPCLIFGLHNRDSHRRLCAGAFLGVGERRRNTRWTESRRRQVFSGPLPSLSQP